jgi:formate hydrogenlyase subunit 3/multisubunit Na+/H+ antiporter MnhD subunit
MFSMLKIWNEAFLKPPQEESGAVKIPRAYTYAILILTLWTIGLGLRPSVLTNISDHAAKQIIETQNYIRTLQGSTK